MSTFLSRTPVIGRIAYKSMCLNIGTIFKQPQYTRPFARSLVVLSKSTLTEKSPDHSLTCSCGCGIQHMHTKGDKDLVEFLQQEIVQEKANKPAESVPNKLDDFTIEKHHSEITLSKKFNDEEVRISLNVNHTVDATPTTGEGQEQEGALESRPDFEIDIKVGQKTLSFTCQFTDYGDNEPGEQADVFGISEVTIYEGEWDEAKYGVSGDILDGNLYDLFMNFLEERGITVEFVQKLGAVCTNYEHNQYIKMLEDIQTFVKRK